MRRWSFRRGHARAAGVAVVVLLGSLSIDARAAEPAVPAPTSSAQAQAPVVPVPAPAAAAPTSSAQPQAPVIPLPPPVVAAPVPARRNHPWLVNAGLITFGGGYGWSIFFGLLALQMHEQPGLFVDVEYYRIVGRDLLIPLAGPWMAIADSDSGIRGGLWFATLGVAQAVGLLLVIVGKSGPAPPPSRTNDNILHAVTIQAAPTHGGAISSVVARF
jgi:hypothetical protein